MTSNDLKLKNVKTIALCMYVYQMKATGQDNTKIVMLYMSD